MSCDARDARIFVNVELDTETGLYYYGARYLDQRYSRWLSGDPAITDYMAGTSAGEGGIYNTVNLHLYHYAGIGQRSDSELQANNPIKYVDPDGRASEAAGYSGNYSGKEKSPIKKIGDGFVNLIKNIGRGISDGASWIMENKEAIGNIIAGGVLILAGETTKKGGWALGVALSPESGGASVLIILTAEEAGKVLEVSGGVLISNGANMLMANSNKNYREKTRGQIKTTVK